jgi:DNA-binding response OmpR family regulator
MHTLLVIDDKNDILDLVEDALVNAGYDVIGCLHTSTVKQVLADEPIDLIIMDRNLAGIEGSAFMQYLRDEGYTQPVIYFSSDDSDKSISKGFSQGRDSYISQPLHLELLIDRVNAIIKRDINQTEIFTHRDICYHTNNKKLFIDREEIALTPLERNLLLEFMHHPHMLIDRHTLLDRVWEDAEHTKSKTVNVAIKRLKEKIDPTGDKAYIKSIRGAGYILC